MVDQSSGGGSWIEDPRTIVSALAVLVALSTLVQSMVIQRWTAISAETRDHFDADVRDVVYDYLKDIRMQRESITRINYGGDDGVEEFDKIYDERISPSLVQMSLVLEAASRRYSRLLSGIVYVCIEGVAYEKAIDEYLLEDLSNRIDAVHEALLAVRRAALEEASRISFVDLRVATLELGKSVRALLNEIRARIATRRRPRYQSF